MGPGIPEPWIWQRELHEHVLNIVAIEPERPPHLQGRGHLKIVADDPDAQLAGHDPAIEVAQPDA